MKSAFGIFVLTRREQRAVILIVITLVTATIANHYWNQRSHIIPAPSTSAETTATPSAASAEDEAEASESP